MPVLERIQRDFAAVVRRSSTPTVSNLSSPWKNPSDVLSLLMIIGGDIVRAALAQLSGGMITPVCFSFGWVSYGFLSVASFIGDGRLMPPPDYACKVINLAADSGHSRDNKNWMVGRLMRDLEAPLDEGAICVRILDAVDGTNGQKPARQVSRDWVWTASLLTMLVQCGIAAIPYGLYGDWGILLVTVAGTMLALLTGALPQWKVEKYAARVDSEKIIALVVGNGSRHLAIIRGNGRSLDFEDLASNQGPKIRRSWNDFAWFQKPECLKDHAGKSVIAKAPLMFRGLPLDFRITFAVCMILAVCWVAILITVTGLKNNTWFLVAVGAIGMAQNACVAAVSRTSEVRGIHLQEYRQLRGTKVMDVFMDVECLIPGAGRILVKEYFPAGLREKYGEMAWWNGQRTEYDQIRLREQATRGVPESMKKEEIHEA